MKLLMDMLYMAKISYVSYTLHDVSNVEIKHSGRTYSTYIGPCFRQLLMM